MKKSIFKINKLKIHVWVSGSQLEPNSHMWFDSKKSDIGYKSLNVIPYRKSSGKIGLSNATPKFIQLYLSYKAQYNLFKSEDGLILDKDGCVIGIKENYKPISFLKFSIARHKELQKIKKCTHPHMEYDSDISPDSGSESFFCPDCGYADTIVYY